MTKLEFMNRLEKLLNGIPEEEKQELLYDYEEHFRMEMESGKTEEEITKSLGKPEIIAKECKTNYHLENATKNKSVTSLFRAIYTSIGLGFFNLVFLLGPFIAALGIIFSLYVVSLSLVLTPVAVISSYFFVDQTSEFFLNLFISIGCLGLGLLTGVLAIKVSRIFITWFIKYVRSNLNMIKGENYKSGESI
ncbi:DUF1700 domain-containing protein [Bacillus sp. FJAT-47783]|uniref:HAAS signaling domain-containing protein n=1 Tax=Bacillus sp. FJAT-47783 TaxID=2922712 RepID=UPI001FACFB5E|nr:DUF1700 domain-containing protein [Bacillus sp. FJAT-47783]